MIVPSARLYKSGYFDLKHMSLKAGAPEDVIELYNDYIDALKLEASIDNGEKIIDGVNKKEDVDQDRKYKEDEKTNMI